MRCLWRLEILSLAYGRINGDRRVLSLIHQVIGKKIYSSSNIKRLRKKFWSYIVYTVCHRTHGTYQFIFLSKKRHFVESNLDSDKNQRRGLSDLFLSLESIRTRKFLAVQKIKGLQDFWNTLKDWSSDLLNKKLFSDWEI